jgi:hypothetical protein
MLRYIEISVFHLFDILPRNAVKLPGIRGSVPRIYDINSVPCLSRFSFCLFSRPANPKSLLPCIW